LTHSYTEQHIDSEFKQICRRQDRDEMNERTWFVGSNGNWFRDMGGYRYCVAYIGSQQWEVARNGIVFGGRFDNINNAKAACEWDSNKVQD